MMDYYTLGSTPSDEDCAQVGSTNYDYAALSRKERVAWKNQLDRSASLEFQDSQCFLRSKRFEHDFGSYFEVVVWFDDDDPAQVELATKLENEAPTRWDSEARAELGEAYFVAIALDYGGRKEPEL